MPAYHACEKKREAREVTIVKNWERLTGRKDIPQGRQFWSLCGPLIDSQGKYHPGSELGQLVGAGLISTDQYHGVEKDPTIYEANQKACQHMKPAPYLYLGEIQHVMEEAKLDRVWRPGVVNLDTTHEPKRAVGLLGYVLALLDDVEGGVMVVLNCIIDNPHRGALHRPKEEGLLEAVNADVLCGKMLYQGGWQQIHEIATYGGTGKTAVKMGTLVFYRPV